MGCSVGRLVLELSKYYKESIGIDYHVRYFSLGETMIEEGYLNHSGKKLAAKDFCSHPDRPKFIQMNPENTNPKFIFNSELIIVDGTNIKAGRIANVVKNSKCLLKPN